MWRGAMARTCCLHAAFAAGLVGLLCSAGCGSGKNSVETVPVRGKVSYNGEPVTEGTLSFEPVHDHEGGEGARTRRPAIGVIQADGTYEMSSFEAKDGVVPGEYKVAIQSYKGGPSPEDPTAAEEWLIPKKYGNSSESGLTAKVPADETGAVEIDFELTD